MRVSMKSSLLAGVIAVGICGQSLAAGPQVYDGYKAPRDSLGRPDLSAVWSAATITRLERKPSLGNRLVMTPREVEEAEGRIKAANDLAAKPTDPHAGAGGKDLPADCSDGRGKDCNYNSAWTDPGTKVARVHGEPHNSILTTPDGRVPVDLHGKRTSRELGGEEEQSYTPQPGEAPPDPPGMNDNPETRALTERCLTYGSEVIRSMTYNNNYAIQQGDDFVAIESEMIHDARIVRLNAKHRTDGIRQWGGDSIGWYEGDTLVVETTGLDPRQVRFGGTEQLKITERFTRVSPTRLLYAFTLEDPRTWAKPWGGEYEFTLSPGLYEYACHEGNYGLQNILSGARAEEAQAKAKPGNSGG